MSEPFVSEIRLMSFSHAPKGWATCNGQLMHIEQNQALFALLGTNYGGDGKNNFALPDFRGRVPIHEGAGHALGERGGVEAHTLSLAELPAHTHFVRASSSPASTPVPSGALPAAGVEAYAPPSGAQLVPLNPQTVSNSGGNLPHENMQPFLTLNFCIALVGTFPSPG